MNLGDIAFWILMVIFGCAGIVGLWIACVCGVGYMIQHQYDPPMSAEQKRSWWVWAGVVVFSLVIAALRLTVPTRHAIPTWPLSYEAVAHVWVGLLVGAGLSTGSWTYWWPLILLTGWEIGVFLFF